MHFGNALLTLQIFKDEHSEINHHYILNPVSASLKLLLNKSNVPDKKTPKYTFHFEFDEIALALEQLQYRQLMGLMDWINMYSNAEKYKKFKPKTAVKADPKAWWKFACTYNKL